MSYAGIGYWSEPLPWSADRDPLAIPSGIKAGDIIISDLMIRPQCMNNRPKQFYPQQVWTVVTGSAFQVTPPADEWPRCNGMVIDSFQIWGGTKEQLNAHEDDLIRDLLKEVDLNAEMEETM